MRLPPFSKSSIPSRLGKGRPSTGLSHCYEAISSPIRVQTLEHVQEEIDYELPLSREAKSPAYPEGPVCIYEPHVYLYLEPSDTEASKFDVVLNVAREVVNPFKSAMDMAIDSESKDAVAQVSLDSRNVHLPDRESMSEPQTAISDKSFRSAFETLPDVIAISSSPESLKAPEYIHIPWDHNTNVVDDLLRLCELIDDRVQNGKRVLVHCQCGVSRSASLVVAYGLYKNPQLTVQDAYTAVKHRSRWIGPNMNLIYQLSEFKEKVLRKLFPGSSTWPSSRNLVSGRGNPRATFNTDSNSATPPSLLRSVPTSAPLKKDQETTPARANSFTPAGSTQVAETSTMGDISPGPSSAPPTLQRTLSEQVPDSDGELKHEIRDDLDDQNPRSLFTPQTLDIDSPSQMKTSLSSPNITMDFCITNAKPKTESSTSRTNMVPLHQTPISLSPSDTACAENAALELTSPPEPEPTQTIRLGCMDTNSQHSTSSPAPPAKPTNINIPSQDLNSISSPATRAVETAIRLPPSFTSDEYETGKTTPKTPPMPPTLPAGFSSLSARRAKSSLALRQEASKSLRPQLSLIGLNNPALQNLSPTPSLLSPRAAEFTASPFHRTTAGDLAGSSVFEQALMSPRALEEDPRSPAMRGEAPITRSIFDVL